MSAHSTPPLLREQTPEDEPVVRTLFRAVYPHDPNLADRLKAPHQSPNHITTWLALEGELVVGQANVYRFPRSPESANLGFHVHPDFRRRGIARALSEAAVERTRETDVARLLIRTHRENFPARALAEQLGFSRLDGPPGDPTLLWFALDLRAATAS